MDNENNKQEEPISVPESFELLAKEYENFLRSTGRMFPITVDQVKAFEKHMEGKRIPELHESLRDPNKILERGYIRPPRFRMPTSEELVEVAIIFNDGKLDEKALANMVSMSHFILDRLYENGDMRIPSSKEKRKRKSKA